MRIVPGTPVLIAILAAAALAQQPSAKPPDVYTSLKLIDVELVSGTWPVQGDWFGGADPVVLGARLDSGAEGFLRMPEVTDPRATVSASTEIVLRSPAGADVTGTLSFPPSRTAGLSREVRIRIPKDKLGNATRQDWLRSARAHYHRLLDAGLPGAAWFRHRVAECTAELPKEEADPDARSRFPGRSWFRSSDEIDETYEMFSAGRAVAENLRLDRELVPIDGGTPSIPVASIEGITTAAFDWKAAAANLAPAKDPLAAAIPEDQHAAFFPGLAQLAATLDALESQGAPMLESLEDGSEDAGTRAFYERQLALPLSELLASDVAASIASVAITGSDPYFRTGTDVAVLFECSKPEALQTWLAARHAKALAGRPDGVAAPLKLDELCITVTTPDRGLSSYVTTAGKVVVVTNSSAQMKRVLTTARGGAVALASSPEYTFFRDRYRRGDPAETAFLLLTDATIRRWCGPRWRIGDSRRTRAAARLADATAEMAAAMISGSAKAPTIPGLDRVTLTPEGVMSFDYGNLRFLRPIVELDVENVTKAEADAYGRFRDTYQQRWTTYFDPIAIRLGVAKTAMSLDVTVMPLVASTDYRDLVDLTKGAKLAPTACDPHDNAAIQFAFGLDLAASSFEPGARRIMKLEKIAAGWLKGGFAISLDRDPLLDRVDDVESDASWKLIPRLPLMITAEVADPVALALFLASIRTAVEDTGVGSVKWTKAAYKDVETMTLLPTSEMLPDDVTLRIQYAIVDKLLYVSLREDQLHRAIDRALERRANPAAAGPPWLGESVALRVDKSFAELAARLSAKWRDEQARRQAWRALPILHEWLRLFPDQDPVAVHERLFKVRLHDPAGGAYTVDRASGRIVSATYGHPAETRPGPKRPAILEGFKDARAGLTFENDGVRARIVIERESK